MKLIGLILLSLTAACGGGEQATRTATPSIQGTAEATIEATDQVAPTPTQPNPPGLNGR